MHEDPPAPEAPLYAIGDVHGRDDLLIALLETIARDAEADGVAAEAEIVCLGDYVDRGDESRGTVELLQGLATDPDARLRCLMGNHERMMLDFLDAPEGPAGRWPRYGGDATLLSWGVDPTEGTAAAQAAQLREALGAETEAWLRALPLAHRSGDVVLAHAGLDPELPPEAQSPQVLLWGAPGIHARARTDGLWVVHGHVARAEPVLEERRICCDTGAYYSDRLTAVALRAGAAPRFLCARS
jgi:serine/threonine protein phosphatase 1